MACSIVLYADTMLQKKMGDLQHTNCCSPIVNIVGTGVTVQASCYPNGTMSYSWNSSSLTWQLQIEYQCYSNGTTHEQTVSSTSLVPRLSPRPNENEARGELGNEAKVLLHC